MGPDLDLEQRKETAMEGSTSKDHSAFVPIPKDKSMKSESKDTFDMGMPLHKRDMEVCNNEDVDVDIINCKIDDEDVDVDIVNCTNDDEDVEVDIVNCKNDDEDVEVDIINCTNDDEFDLVQPQSGDATASSSSFDDTYPGVGNCEYGSDNEVMSEFCGDVAPMRGFPGSADEFPSR